MRFLLAILVFPVVCSAALTPEQIAQLPPPATHAINFSTEVKPIFEASCIKCHGRGKDKGGFRLDNRDTFIRGGDSGPAVVVSNSAQSLLVALIQGFDPDSVMPKKGSHLTPDQISLMRAWIDQGAPWDSNVTFGRLEPLNLKPRTPELPRGPKDLNPIDRLLRPYFTAHKLTAARPVSDRVFARRAYLDIVGLLPPSDELKKFLGDHHSDKRARLVDRLLADDRNYAENWLSFWNDLLRNDYKGTGYIDGGRKQITGWLYSALLTNMPYDKFVSQLISPTPESEGFTKGIVWRGVVNASQTPQMQAAQSICQVFMGVNLKCASCHDSFINDLTLADAYGLAGIYAEGPLEMVHCDKQTGKKAQLKFIYPELGPIDAEADKSVRLKQLAHIITQPEDGRLTRTFVNRLWQRFFGRGLVEPVDDMEKAAWSPDLLDWLAQDFAAHSYDVRFLIKRMLTSRAYQLPAMDLAGQTTGEFVFRGPLVRRMNAEQFRDAITSLAGVGYASPAVDVTPTESEQKRFALPISIKWIWNDAHAADKAPPGHVYFRKTIKLSTVPSDATAVVVADNSFTLFVNGKKLGSGGDFKTAFLFDLRTHLMTGENVFAIDAVNNLPDNSPPEDNKPLPNSDTPAGLLFYARVRSTGGQTVTNDFGSDDSWLCSTNTEKGWEKSSPPAGDWDNAMVLGDPGMIPWRVTKEYLRTRLASFYPGRTRAALVPADSLTTALGRPNREQVVTTRPPEATTLQALELTNGEILASTLKKSAKALLANSHSDGALTRSLYMKALGRDPSSGEMKLAGDLLGHPVQAEGVEDFLWSLAMLPEFQLIY